MTRILVALVLFSFACLAAAGARAEDVRVKDLGRFLGWRENALVGYGLVTGLAGSGDSPRSDITRQALRNVLSRLGANVSENQIQSRNVAAVIVTATLPPTANVGDRIDANVSSIGDARSLVGGTLLMTPLLGPDQRPYGLAQGTLVVGGYRFDANMNREQENYPAAGVLPGGATVETSVSADLVSNHQLTFILKDADATTAERVAMGINAAVAPGIASVRDAGAVAIQVEPEDRDIYSLISRVENVSVTPDSLARVVINERSGTVVSGGGVRISSVVVSKGDIRVSVSVENEAGDLGGLGYGGGRWGRGLIVTNTKLAVTKPSDAVISFPDTSVADLVEGLSRAHVDTRGVISVLQAIKAAGALHADLVVQ